MMTATATSTPVPAPTPAPAPAQNPVPKRISSVTYTNSIGVMVLRQFAPALAGDVEAICERITAEIDARIDRVLPN